MGRIRLHRNEFDPLWLRGLSLLITVTLFGLFSAAIIWLIAAEASSDTFAPIAQGQLATRGGEWNPARWAEEIPVVISLLLVPAFAGMVIGVQTLSHGGLLGFFVALFNLLPFHMGAGKGIANQLNASPVVWAGFIVGAILAFYAGDIGSWICRRRYHIEAIEDDYDRDISDMGISIDQ